MAEYLVELYVAQGDHDTARQYAARAELAAAELTREGRPVRCVRSIFVPEDETCFLLFEADSADLVAEAMAAPGSGTSTSPRLSTPHTRRSRDRGCRPTKGTTMTITTTDYTELRDKQQKVWSSGDYNKIAALTVPVSEHLVEHAGVDTRRARPRRRHRHRPRRPRRCPPGGGGDRHRLRAGAARDRPPPGRGRGPRRRVRRGRRRGPAVRRRVVRRRAVRHRRDVQRRPRPGRPGARPRRPSRRPDRARELDARGLRRRHPRTVGKHVAPPAGAQPATRWGTEAVVAELLGDGVDRRRGRSIATVCQRFVDAEDFADLFLTYYGPTYSAAGRLDEEGRAALRADLVALAQTFDRGTGHRCRPRLGVPHRHGDPPLTA